MTGQTYVGTRSILVVVVVVIVVAMIDGATSAHASAFRTVPEKMEEMRAAAVLTARSVP